MTLTRGVCADSACGGPWARARIEAAVNDTLDAGFRTGDIMVGRARVIQHNTHTPTE